MCSDRWSIWTCKVRYIHLGFETKERCRQHPKTDTSWCSEPALFPIFKVTWNDGSIKKFINLITTIVLKWNIIKVHSTWNVISRIIKDSYTFFTKLSKNIVNIRKLKNRKKKESNPVGCILPTFLVPRGQGSAQLPGGRPPGCRPLLR